MIAFSRHVIGFKPLSKRELIENLIVFLIVAAPVDQMTGRPNAINIATLRSRQLLIHLGRIIRHGLSIRHQGIPTKPAAILNLLQPTLESAASAIATTVSHCVLLGF